MINHLIDNFSVRLELEEFKKGKKYGKKTIKISEVSTVDNFFSKMTKVFNAFLQQEAGSQACILSFVPVLKHPLKIMEMIANPLKA